MPKLKLLIILLAWEIVTGSPVEIEKIAEAIETERELDLEGGILPRNVRQRMARFFTDATDAGSAGADLLDLGLDSNAIMRVRNYHSHLKKANSVISRVFSRASCLLRT